MSLVIVERARAPRALGCGNRKEIRNEARKVARDHIVSNPVAMRRRFGFYSKSDEKPLVSFEQGSDRV